MDATITDRLIGCEVECVVPIIGHGESSDVQRLMADVLTRHRIPAISRSYSNTPIPTGYTVAVEHDSSLRDESRYTGIRWAKIEVKTAPMTWNQLKTVLPSTLDIVKYLGARVNGSCGLHTHHHLPEVVENPLVVRNLMHLWWRFHNPIYGLVAPGRKENSFCRPPTQQDAVAYDNCTTYEKLCEMLRRAQRYSGLNLTNLSTDRKTIEWRIHHGTTDYDKISAWILGTQRLVEHACRRSCHFRPEPLPNTQAALNALFVVSGLKSNTRVYRKIDPELRRAARFLLKRWKNFNVPRDFKSISEAA